MHVPLIQSSLPRQSDTESHAETRKLKISSVSFYNKNYYLSEEYVFVKNVNIYMFQFILISVAGVGWFVLMMMMFI